MTRFPFPPQWHFDVLRELEHFRAAGAPADDRLSDAVGVVERARRPDGRWPRYRGYSGRTWFVMEEPGPSRWATLRALRVLDWWARSRADKRRVRRCDETQRTIARQKRSRGNVSRSSGGSGTL